MDIVLITRIDGFGPLLFSPLSEMPHIDRNPPYILGFLGYVVISIVLGAVDNFPGIAILRFLQGSLGSPCLATAGASIKDIYGPKTAPYGLVIWVACIYCGPALGPLFASHAVDINWRWPWWQIVCMSAPSLIVLICLLPETLPDTILIHQAQRLRRENKGLNIVTATEIGGGYSWNVIWDSLIKPVEISLKDPAIAFTSIYTSFIYGIYYSFFEAFPIVYQGKYQMSPTSFGLIFLSIVAGSIIGAILYVVYIYWHGKRRSSAGLSPSGQENDLLPSLPGAILTPAGLFLFGWTARASIHWIVPTIGIAIYSGATFVIYQGLLTYVPQSYPLYAASLFAANDFMRSCTAAVFVMVVPYMYNNLGVPKGVSILGSVSVLGVVGIVILCKYGAKMRARSRFAVQGSG